VVWVFDSNVDVESGRTRPPGHDVQDSIFVLASWVVARQSRDMHFAPWVEIAVAERLKQRVDDGRVHHFTASTDRAGNGVMHVRVKRLATRGSSLVLRLVAACIR
jgi:hypothetical protein